MQIRPQAKKMLSLLLLSTALAACGGGGSGSGGGSASINQLPSGIFIKDLGSEASSTSTLFSNTSPTRYMQLIHGSEIGAAGELSALQFQRHIAKAEDSICPGTTIRLGHSSVEELSATFDDNVEQGKGSFITVIDNSSVTLPAAEAGEFIDIPFHQTFHYNGVDNLVIEVSRTEVCNSANSLKTSGLGGYFKSRRADVADALNATFSTSSRHSMKLAFEGGDKHVDPGAGDFSSNSFPFQGSDTVLGRKVQLLYEATELDGAGPVTGFGMPVALPAPTEEQHFTVTIKMGHSTLSELATGPYAESYSDTPVTVADNLSFRVPPGLTEGEVVWLPLAAVFNYNGIDNLIVEIESTDNSEATQTVRWLSRNNTGVIHRLHGPLGSTEATTANEMSYPARFRFHGSTINRVGTAGLSDPFVFPSYAAGLSSQTLYRAADLGSSGTITRLACRMNTDQSVETEYPNFEVVMSHTEGPTLNSTMAANLLDPVVVFDGAFTVPAGLIRGDWIEIPLSKPFAYDGIHNLIIQTRSDAATSAHNCIASEEDAVRYSDNLGLAYSSDATEAILASHQRDLRLWITK